MRIWTAVGRHQDEQVALIITPSTVSAADAKSKCRQEVKDQIMDGVDEGDEPDADQLEAMMDEFEIIVQEDEI